VKSGGNFQTKRRTSTGLLLHNNHAFYVSKPKLDFCFVIKQRKMTHSTPSVFDLICAGKLRVGSYVTCNIPHKRGSCKGVLQSNGEIAFGIGGIPTLFTLNKFAKKVLGYSAANGWKTVLDEHGVLLDKVRAKYRCEQNFERVVAARPNRPDPSSLSDARRWATSAGAEGDARSWISAPATHRCGSCTSTTRVATSD
jgi:hypothetical protein